MSLKFHITTKLISKFERISPNMNTTFNILLLLLGILFSGIYGLGLKPVNLRCRSISELELFNGFFSCTAMIGAAIFALIGSSLYLPLSGLATAALFGLFFSLCVFLNLKALEVGPLSITTLIVNFSLIMPLAYSFIFLDEDITATRISGILLLVICMFLFTNPKITGEKKMSVKWLLLSIATLVCNGTLSLSAKIYAINTDNLYASSFTAFSYMFATIFSFIIFFILHSKQTKEERTKPREFFTPAMIGLIILIGLSNFGLNIIVVLLATRMDGAIVYPAIQGGGPMIAVLGSRILFGEQITWKKWIAILLGITAIVLLNI